VSTSNAAGADSWVLRGPVDAADVGEQTFGPALYGGEAAGASATAINASLACGVPTAVVGLHEGATVLDLGLGAGADVLISAGSPRSLVPGRREASVGRTVGLRLCATRFPARSRGSD
jgi:arsenite methyltransferase